MFKRIHAHWTQIELWVLSTTIWVSRRFALNTVHQMNIHFYFIFEVWIFLKLISVINFIASKLVSNFFFCERNRSEKYFVNVEWSQWANQKHINIFNFMKISIFFSTKKQVNMVSIYYHSFECTFCSCHICQFELRIVVHVGTLSDMAFPMDKICIWLFAMGSPPSCDNPISFFQVVRRIHKINSHETLFFFFLGRDLFVRANIF